MINKGILLLLIPVSMYSMNGEGAPVLLQDGLTMPRKGTVYQSHSFNTEDIEGEYGEGFVGIVSSAEEERRTRKAQRKKQEAMAALAFQAAQKEKQDNMLQGIFVEEDGSHFYPNEYGAPILVNPGRPKTDFEKALYAEIKAVGEQIIALFNWIID